MPSSSPMPPPSDVHSALINAKLAVIETIAANKRNKKASTKKTVKNKQFTHQFDTSAENYIELMNNFLKMHHKDTPLGVSCMLFASSMSASSVSALSMFASSVFFHSFSLLRSTTSTTFCLVHYPCSPPYHLHFSFRLPLMKMCRMTYTTLLFDSSLSVTKPLVTLSLVSVSQHS